MKISSHRLQTLFGIRYERLRRSKITNQKPNMQLNYLKKYKKTKEKMYSPGMEGA